MNQSDLKQPFFARFLEPHYKQEAQDHNGQQVVPWPVPPTTSPFKDGYTDKWPSDADEV